MTLAILAYAHALYWAVVKDGVAVEYGGVDTVLPQKKWWMIRNKINFLQDRLNWILDKYPVTRATYYPGKQIAIKEIRVSYAIVWLIYFYELEKRNIRLYFHEDIKWSNKHFHMIYNLLKVTRSYPEACEKEIYTIDLGIWAEKVINRIEEREKLKKEGAYQ